jgi:hypothetical protein
MTTGALGVFGCETGPRTERGRVAALIEGQVGVESDVRGRGGRWGRGRSLLLLLLLLWLLVFCLDRACVARSLLLLLAARLVLALPPHALPLHNVIAIS